MSERFKAIVAVHLFLIKDNKILLLRRFNTGYEDGNYSVPAGHIDGGESVIDAMIREAKEEAGITIEENDLKFAHVMHRIKKEENEERIDFFFTCEEWQGEVRIMEPEKCDDLSWFEFDDLPLNVISYIIQALDYYKNQVKISTLGW